MAIGAILAALGAAGSGIASGASAVPGALSSIPGGLGQIPGLLSELGGAGGAESSGGSDLIQALLQQGLGALGASQGQPPTQTGGTAPPVQVRGVPLQQQQQQLPTQIGAPDILQILSMLGPGGGY